MQIKGFVECLKKLMCFSTRNFLINVIVDLKKRLFIFWEYLSDNLAFALVFMMNFIAFIMAVYWSAKEGGEENLEPYVAVLGVAGVLLGILFVNDKMTRPKLIISLSNASVINNNGYEEFFSINIANHSKDRVYINKIFFEVDDIKKFALTYAIDSLGKGISGALIDSRQSISFSFLKNKLTKDLIDKDCGMGLLSICVYDQLEYKFYLKNKDVKVIREEVEKRKGHSIE